MVSAYLCKVSRHSTEGYMGILDCDHKLPISETKYNTHKEKIKNEWKNESERKARPSSIFLFYEKQYSYGKRIGEGNKRLFPSFLRH